MKKFIVLIFILSVSITFIGCLQKQKTDDVTKTDNSKGIWIDLILGGPPLPNQFKAIDSLTKKYNINYKRIEMGCEFSNIDLLLRKKYEIENALYFKELEKTLDKNWKNKFDLEKSKLDSLNIVKLN